jgi:hypothetical protein
MTDVHYVEEGDLDTESEPQEFKLPPFPQPIRAWNDKDCRYSGEKDDYQHRTHDKLFKVWALWGQLRTNQELEVLLNRQEKDKDGDAYVAKNCIVDIICELSKILADTNIVEELKWLKQ